LDLAEEYGRSPEGEREKVEASSTNWPKPADFPPDRVSEYLLASSASRFDYRGDATVEWLDYWEQHEPRLAINALEELIRQGRLPISHSHFWDKIFEVQLAVYGKTEAWPALIRAQRRNWGWTNFSSGDENLRRWSRVKELYQDSWLSFIKSTLMPEPGELSRSYSIYSSFANIVEFLVLLGRLEEARVVTDAAIISTLERAADLELPRPEWLPKDAYDRI
jgi:hypothetical protein